MAEDMRCRNWFIRVTKINNTQNGLYEYDFEDLYNKLIEKYDNIVFALHDKDESNIHAHIIIQNKEPIRFTTLKKLIPYGDIEKQRGTNEQVYLYILHQDETSKEIEKDVYDNTCIKTNIENIDNWLKIAKGQRTDLVKFKDEIFAGATKRELIDKYPSQIACFDKFFETCRYMSLQDKFSKSFRDLQVVYIYGGAGLGKTSYVYNNENVEDIYSVDDYSHPFDEYEGEDVILLDEYRSQFDISYLLKLLDRYPMKLRCRYQNKIACFTKVYIVSNISLDEQYTTLDLLTRQALQRRIHKVIKFIDLNKFQLYKDFVPIENEEIKKEIEDIF